LTATTIPEPASDSLDPSLLTQCDREPIHRPDAIQPHGLLLIADAATLEIRAGAGDLENRLTPAWHGARLDTILSLDATLFSPAHILTDLHVEGTHETFSLSRRFQDDAILIELEPTDTPPIVARAVLAEIDTTAERFELCPDVATLCAHAAASFQRLTGFDRVMVYRFLEDGSGTVLAEHNTGAFSPLLHHRFPASDIPQQARTLYIRNRIRVIPNARYTPAPIRPTQAELLGMDLSDVALRSVSPVHLRYLENMGVNASASISIVIDGMLWGLIACHHATPRLMGPGIRAACRTLGGIMSRQLRAKEELTSYQERLRLRNALEVLNARTDPAETIEGSVHSVTEDLYALLPADGFATVTRGSARLHGVGPDRPALRALAAWINARNETGVFSTHALSALNPDATAYQDLASGVLAISLPFKEPLVLLWLRAEVIETIEWAGNPHKTPTANGILEPRTSFETWKETVRGQSTHWNHEQIQAARRLRRSLIEMHQNLQLRELNHTLATTLQERENLLRQKDFLIREVNHRVQNSLQLVASFLKLQTRATTNQETADSLAEAQRRIAAIGLVHRRLYRDEHFGVIDLARYLDELCTELCITIGAGWKQQMTLDLATVLISADRAINLGLVITELLINASKYAYDGLPGPTHITLTQTQDRIVVSVSDRGTQNEEDPGHGGFGSRMMKAIIKSLSGILHYDHLSPGLRATISLPTSPLPDTPDIPKL